MSAVGSSETHRAQVTNSPKLLGFAALDAGLVGIDLERATALEPCFVHADGERAGDPIPDAEIAARWGEQLRAGMGIRALPRSLVAEHVLTDVAAPLPHDLETGGLRRLSGLSFSAIRHSSLADMFGLFDDDPRLGPGLQAQLFLYGGLGALAALPSPLGQLVPEPYRFRIAAACAFPAFDAYAAMMLGMQPKRELVADRTSDKLAYRLAASLTTHGPALLSSMLAPGLNLSRVRRNPKLLDQLLSPGAPQRRVPQAPLVTNAACASALVSLCEIAPQMVCDYPGMLRPKLVLWTAADAALQPDARILEGFGLGAMMSREKLTAINAGRAPHEQRSVADSLAPFDVDAQGTVVGHGGSGVVVTTLEFALENFLDITSILVGWGQSGETGAKGHFAGVGFGGENALIAALTMAHEGHGLGVADFQYLVAHGTGTRTNSRTDLFVVHAARQAVAELEKYGGRLPTLTVGAPKAIGDGHSMGETGLKAIGEAIHYVLGDASIGVPTLRRLDPDLGEPAAYVSLSADVSAGNTEGGALVPTQGFGGFDGAIALRSANPDTLRRYGVEPRVLEAYLERWPQIRRERIEREARWRRTPGFILKLAELHRWPGAS
jgi:hypothetical protein